MRISEALAALMLWAGGVAAYTNSTMTEDFRKFIAGDMAGAFHLVYVTQWGDWWYLVMALAPYTAMYLYQQRLTIPSIWLVCVLVSYRYLFADVPDYITYLLIVVWVFTAVYDAAAPVKRD